jgi:hypothetical protein
VAEWGRHRSLARVRVVAVPCVLAPVLALSACGSSGSDVSPARHGTRKQPGAVTTTTASSTSSTAIAKPYSFEPPPRLVNSGTDYVAIAKSLLEYDAWLLSHHPDPSLIERVATRGTDPYKALAHDVPILRAKQRRLVEEVDAAGEFQIVSVREDVVSLRFVQHLKRVYVVDSGGATSSARPLKKTTYLVLLVKRGTTWFLAAADDQGAGAVAES